MMRITLQMHEVHNYVGMGQVTKRAVVGRAIKTLAEKQLKLDLTKNEVDVKNWERDINTRTYIVDYTLKKVKAKAEPKK